jgi:chromosome segregation ATPase
MVVESNFERLEREVNRLVEGLAQMRQENAALQTQIETLKAENEHLKSNLLRAEEHSQESLKNREEIKGRIENILTKLEAVEV